jgi:uncharacterized protein
MAMDQQEDWEAQFELEERRRAEAEKQDSLNEDLRLAACQGMIEEARCLIERGADARSSSAIHGTALWQACESGNAKMAEILLPLSDPLARAPYGQTPLMAAARKSPECVRLLLPVSVPMAIDEEDGADALMHAAKEGKIECVKLLLPVSDTRRASKNGLTALMWAAARGHEEAAELLLPHSDPLARGGDNWSVLELAAGVGLTDLVAKLLPVANAKAASRSGQTALIAALSGGHDETALALLPFSDADAKTTDGRSALHAAAICGEGATVEALLAAGSDPKSKSDIGTPWLAAMASGNVKAARILMPFADAQERGADGATALMRACQRVKMGDFVAELIEMGADVNASQNDGHTALMLAATNGAAKTVEILLAFGADPFATDHRGMSALHCAAHANNPGAAKLLAPVSDLAAKNTGGFTAEDLAASQGNTRCAREIATERARREAIAEREELELAARQALADNAAAAAKNGEKTPSAAAPRRPLAL